MATGQEFEVQELNVVDPHPRSVESPGAGEVGVVIAGVKSLDHLQIGDTITEAKGAAEIPLPGFQESC